MRHSSSENLEQSTEQTNVLEAKKRHLNIVHIFDSLNFVFRRKHESEA